jgi:hypothetical protein
MDPGGRHPAKKSDEEPVMALHSIELGYCPMHFDIRIGDILLTDLPDHEESVEIIEGSETVHQRWIYAPLQRQRDFVSGQTRVLPHSNRVFGLPKTHLLTQGSTDSTQRLEFLVWCIGFFVGMRLTTAEAGFVDATPVEPGKLNDFVLSGCTLDQAIDLSDKFWQAHAEEERNIKRVMGIIHALFLSQNPLHFQFEAFSYLYMALDACFALTKSICGAPSSHLTHAARLKWMCEQFEIPVPDWAQPTASNNTDVSIVRNDAIHEALFFEEPLGFAIYGGNKCSSHHRNVPLEMQALTCRLLVALLGKPDCDYVKSEVNSRQRHGLSLS